jgi:hypothetical protein
MMHANIFARVPLNWFKILIASGLLMTGLLGMTSSTTAKTESFRRSCSEVREGKVNGQRVISALCERSRRSDGAIQIGNDSRLVVPREGCEDISNNEGNLQCNGAEHPRGSWSQSCVEGRYIRQHVFQAVCASGGNGPDTYTSLDVRTCPNFSLDNINGQLRCH